MQPVVGAHLPLEQLNEALELAGAQKVFGRIVIDVAGPTRNPHQEVVQ